MKTITMTDEIKKSTLLRRGWFEVSNGYYRTNDFKESSVSISLDNAFDYEVEANNNFTFCNGKLIDC